MGLNPKTAKIILGILVFLFIVVWGYLGYSTGIIANKLKTTKEVISPFAKELTNKITSKYNHSFDETKPINILLLGIDRRSRLEYGYRTDIMILISVNPKTNRIAMVSLPRDLWYDSGRLNAVYMFSGFERLADGFEEITGLRPQKFVLTDFEDFKWIVDAMGGVPVNVQTTFTDYDYPVDATLGYQTVTFVQGPEKLTGERALIFSRSRKGDYDNGDWGRMKRQHLVLKGMLEAVKQPESIFNPMVVEEAFKIVTTNKMDTNLSLDDAKYLWDFYKDKDKYQIESFYLDYDYIYTPPASEYGGAWVLTETDGGYGAFTKKVTDYLNNVPTIQYQVESHSTL